MRRARGWLVTLTVVVGLQIAPGPTHAWTDWPGEWRPGRPSVARVAARPAAAQLAPIEGSAFRLEVPFRTQKDGGRWQTSNCGPATLGMVLDGFGVGGAATDDLRYRAHSYQGTVGMRTGTALEHIARVAEDFGVPTIGLYRDDGKFRNWSIEDVRRELRLGRPVMPLVRLHLLPGKEDVGVRWGHYILLTGETADGFFYNDSLQTDPAVGTSGLISASQLERAMQASHIPGQAVAFGGPNLSPLTVWTPAT